MDVLQRAYSPTRAQMALVRGSGMFPKTHPLDLFLYLASINEVMDYSPSKEAPEEAELRRACALGNFPRLHGYQAERVRK